FVEIAMPSILTEDRFCGESFQLLESDMCLLRDATSPTSPRPISLFGANTAMGPIWRALKLQQTTISPSADEYETLYGRWKPSGEGHLLSGVAWELRLRMKTALDKMISSGDIEIRSGLRLDVGNSLVPFLRKPREGEDPFSDTLVPVPQQHKVLRMSPMGLAELLIPLKHTGRRTLSVAWREARGKLQDLDVGGLDEANRTVVRVLDIIREAREQTKAEIEGLNQLVASLENDPASVTEPFFWGTVAQRICRMVGVDASTDWEENAWTEDLQWKLIDHQIVIGEMTGRIIPPSEAKGYSGQQRKALGIKIRQSLEELIETCDFEGQGDLLEAEYQLLVQQVDELSR
ncbi:hypothetical protein Neosp_006517, partial [[Neocosmospora] mangrovei]